MLAALCEKFQKNFLQFLNFSQVFDVYTFLFHFLEKVRERHHYKCSHFLLLQSSTFCLPECHNYLWIVRFISCNQMYSRYIYIWNRSQSWMDRLSRFHWMFNKRNCIPNIKHRICIEILWRIKLYWFLSNSLYYKKFSNSFGESLSDYLLVWLWIRTLLIWPRNTPFCSNNKIMEGCTFEITPRTVWLRVHNSNIWLYLNEPHVRKTLTSSMKIKMSFHIR